MNNHKYIGSTEGRIDWDSIIKTVQARDDGDFNSVASVMERVDDDVASGNVFETNGADMSQDETEELVESYYDLISIWTNAGYRLPDIQWYDYYQGQHFDFDVDGVIKELTGATKLRTFISEVHPGRIVPYHWDIEDFEVEWNKLGDMVRYVVFMHDPQPGHLFALNEHCFYTPAKHEVWEWSSRKDWHAAANCGTTPYYLYHYLGYK